MRSPASAAGPFSNLRAHAGAKGRKARAAVQEVTCAVERSVQLGLDIINDDNPHPGGMPF